MISVGENSYVTIDEAEQFAFQRGVSIPCFDALSAELFSAMDYLESLRWVGEKLDPSQPLSWPRRYGCDKIGTPSEIGRAQILLAISSLGGIKIDEAIGRENITSKSVGDVSVSYGAPRSTIYHPQVARILSPFLRPALKVRRA